MAPLLHCSICNNTDNEGGNWVSTFCGHLFHASCLSRWLHSGTGHNTCGLCQTPLQRRPNNENIIRLYFTGPDDDGGAQEEGREGEEGALDAILELASKGGMQDLEQKVAQLREHLKKQVQPFEEKAKQLQRQVDALQRQVAIVQELQEGLQFQKDSISALEGELAASKKREDEIKRRLQDKIEDSNDKRKQIEWRDARIRKLEWDLKESKASLTRVILKTNPCLKGEELARTIADLNVPTDNKAYLVGLLENRSEVLSKANARAEKLEKEVWETQAELKEVRDQLEAAKQVAAAAAAAGSDRHAQRPGLGNPSDGYLAARSDRQYDSFPGPLGEQFAGLPGDAPLRSNVPRAGFRSAAAKTVRQNTAAAAAAAAVAASVAAAMRGRPAAPPVAARSNAAAPASAAPAQGGGAWRSGGAGDAQGAGSEEEELVLLDDSQDPQGEDSLDSGDAGQFSEIESDAEELDIAGLYRQQHRSGDGAENDPDAGSTRSMLDTVMVAAGPTHFGALAAPGPSFITDAARATTGLDGGGQFIKHGPDGRAGQATAYLSGGTFRSSAALGGKQPVAKRGRKRTKAGDGADLRHFFAKTAR